MRYKDILYGEWEVPKHLEKIIHTPEMARIRNIAMTVAPNALMRYGTVPSRFHHCMGVACLASLVTTLNPALGEDRTLLIQAASLLHDAGNPPFSHLSEHFLREMTGMDGESFLQRILDGSEMEKILREIGSSVAEVTRMVTGSSKPLSDVLCGSMDIDNLDNIARFNYAIGNVQDTWRYDPVAIASSMEFKDGLWQLSLSCKDQCMKWKNARKAAYTTIYGTHHFTIVTMLHRAVELAFVAGDIKEDFFFLEDHAAFAHLLHNCNPRTKILAERLKSWEWYEEINILEASRPTEKFAKLAKDWKGRKSVADAICEELLIGEDKICVYLGKGKESRKITLPFVESGGNAVFDEEEDDSVYRAMVYVHPEYMILKNDIHECAIASMR